IVRVPVRDQRKGHDVQVNTRTVLDDRDARTSIRNDQIGGVDPAAVAREADVAPAPVAETAEQLYAIGRRQLRNWRKFAARAGEHVDRLHGERFLGGGRERHRGRDREAGRPNDSFHLESSYVNSRGWIQHTPRGSGWLRDRAGDAR